MWWRKSNSQSIEETFFPPQILPTVAKKKQKAIYKKIFMLSIMYQKSFYCTYYSRSFFLCRGDCVVKKKYLLTGAVVGFINGLLGGGAGAILVPILGKYFRLSPQKSLATSLAVLFPLSCLSVALYWLQGNIDWAIALPYVCGGAVGGIVGGRFFPKIKVSYLQKGFSLLLLVAGLRCLL